MTHQLLVLVEPWIFDLFQSISTVQPKFYRRFDLVSCWFQQRSADHSTHPGHPSNIAERHIATPETTECTNVGSTSGTFCNKVLVAVNPVFEGLKWCWRPGTRFQHILWCSMLSALMKFHVFMSYCDAFFWNRYWHASPTKPKTVKPNSSSCALHDMEDSAVSYGSKNIGNVKKSSWWKRAWNNDWYLWTKQHETKKNFMQIQLMAP